MKKTTKKQIFWQESRIDSEARERIKGHEGGCVWLTGFSASGKSSIAFTLEKILNESGVHTYVLDGDNLRHGLCADLGFSPEDRNENIRRAGAVAGLFADAGVVVIAAFISPYREGREAAREKVGSARFIETWVQCPIDVCEERDPKGLYAKAKEGVITNFTGINAPYEEPTEPALTLNTAPEENTPASCAGRIIELLKERGILPDD